MLRSWVFSPFRAGCQRPQGPHTHSAVPETTSGSYTPNTQYTEWNTWVGTWTVTVSMCCPEVQEGCTALRDKPSVLPLQGQRQSINIRGQETGLPVSHLHHQPPAQSLTCKWMKEWFSTEWITGFPECSSRSICHSSPSQSLLLFRRTPGKLSSPRLQLQPQGWQRTTLALRRGEAGSRE